MFASKPLLDLPLDILLLIADNLPLRALSTTSRTCRTLHSILTPALTANSTRYATWSSGGPC